MRFQAGLLFGLICVSATVQAADNGECGTPEAMTAKFKAEGQRSFASAERVERKYGINALYGMIFTLNADRTVGARKPGLDPASLLKATDADA